MLGRLKFSRKTKAGKPAPPAGDEWFAAPAPGFDEAAYLRANPDVAAKVAAQPGSSGWGHFVAEGWLENRVGVPRPVYDEVRGRRIYELEHILPPAFLRQRFHGATDVNTFEQVGGAVAADLIGYLNLVKAAGPEFRVLDFGVGCARVLIGYRTSNANRALGEGRSNGADRISTGRRSNGARHSWARVRHSPSMTRCRRCRTLTAFSTSSTRFRFHPSARDDAIRLARGDQPGS